MKNNPITAIVVLYYSKHLVEGLLTNITEKISDLDEIILVDNSNEDLSEFMSSFVKIIHSKQNIGYGAAINLGVKHAKNENIIALNPDIGVEKFEFNFENPPAEHFLLSGKPLEWQYVRKFPTLTYDFLRIALYNLAKPFQLINKISGKKNIKNLKHPIIVDWISGAFIVTTKTTMASIGGFDEKYFLFYEEVDLCKRAAFVGILSYLTPHIEFSLNQGTASLSDVSEIKNKSEIFSAVRYHSKYSGKSASSFVFFGLKLYTFTIEFSFKVLDIIVNSEKIRKKVVQYKTYAKSL